MKTFSRDYYINLIEDSYFGNVTRADISSACGCFTDSSEIVIYHGDNPVRRFYKNPSNNEDSLEVFYNHLVGNYNALFEDFVHTIDLECEKVASNFIVTLKPKQDSVYLSSGTLTLNNSNFFRFKNGKINYMIIYYANPTLGSMLNNSNNGPTGFPK